MEKEIVSLYKSGNSYRDIAMSLKISFTTISIILKKYKVRKHTVWNKGKKIQTNTGKTHFKKGHKTWNKGKKTQTNTGRTHFKKGRISPRKGKKLEEIYTSKKICDKMRETSRRNAINLVIEKCDTKPERMVENWLLFNNILYIKQYKYKIGVADFWLPKTNTIIEVDGDYWHSLPGYKERDERQTQYLESLDYNVFRFRESLVLKDVDECLSSMKW